MPPEQIEVDFFMGNFGCLQKKYGSPVQHNSHEVWTWIIELTKDKKDERFTCLGGTSCHKIAWGPSWILIIWNNRPFIKEFHETVRQLVSVHLAERTGRSRPPCTLWLDQNRQLCIHRMLQFHFSFVQFRLNHLQYHKHKMKGWSLSCNVPSSCCFV